MYKRQRVIFVKGIGVKPHKTYWKQKADTAFKWVAKEYEKQQLTEKEIEEQKRVDGRRDLPFLSHFTANLPFECPFT